MATVWRKELRFSLCVYIIVTAVGFMCSINPPMKLNWHLPFFPSFNPLHMGSSPVQIC